MIKIRIIMLMLTRLTILNRVIIIKIKDKDNKIAVMIIKMIIKIIRMMIIIIKIRMMMMMMIMKIIKVIIQIGI